MATKSSKSDWNALLQDVKKTARTVREHIETAPPGVGIPTQDPVLQQEFNTNAQLAYQKLEEAGMRLANIVQTYEGVKKPFAGQTL
jgi:hypothetical protein